MKIDNSMRVAKLDTVSELQMSVQRVTPYIEGVTPTQDEICFLISGYSPTHDIEINDEYILLSMSEARRLINILEVMTMHEDENRGLELINQ